MAIFFSFSGLVIILTVPLTGEGLFLWEFWNCQGNFKSAFNQADSRQRITLRLFQALLLFLDQNTQSLGFYCHYNTNGYHGWGVLCISSQAREMDPIPLPTMSMWVACKLWLADFSSFTQGQTVGSSRAKIKCRAGGASNTYALRPPI